MIRAALLVTMITPSIVVAEDPPILLEASFEAHYLEELPVASVGALRGAYLTTTNVAANRSHEVVAFVPAGFKTLCALVTSKEGAYRGEGPYHLLGPPKAEGQWVRLELPKPRRAASRESLKQRLGRYKPDDLAVRVLAIASTDCGSIESGAKASPVLLPVVWVEAEATATELGSATLSELVLLVNGVTAGISQARLQRVGTPVNCFELSGLDFNRYSHRCQLSPDQATGDWYCNDEVQVRFRAGRRVDSVPPIAIRFPSPSCEPSPTGGGQR